jgi:hypothetical protein
VPFEEVILAVSDEAQIAALRQWLTQPHDGDAGLTVVRKPARPAEGELGALDVLVVLASSTGLVAAVKTLPEFFRSRRATVRIETVIRGQAFIIDATNVDDVLTILLRVLGEPDALDGPDAPGGPGGPGGLDGLDG